MCALNPIPEFELLFLLYHFSSCLHFCNDFQCRVYVYISNNTFNDQLMTYVFENIYFIISMCLQYVECGFSIRQRIQCHLVFQEESIRIKFFYIIL